MWTFFQRAIVNRTNENCPKFESNTKIFVLKRIKSDRKPAKKRERKGNSKNFDKPDTLKKKRPLTPVRDRVDDGMNKNLGRKKKWKFQPQKGVPYLGRLMKELLTGSLKKMTQMSVFKPANKAYYEVKAFADFLTIGQSPIPKTVIIQSPSPSFYKPTLPKIPRTKKKWTVQHKKEAVKKAREIGLTKATRFLQKNYPETFCDLSPSTLQYWIQKFD
ncbi:hypothetical protein EIN_005650 [Entamoeba invadens IP1]|uniref:Uncharacterized protein n=1 Tax=Entamoeba invadens IP1 TaxID=370355 RepID=A0A0A1UCL2_ENTIV|nr:hypothetical protein EIN_005650 [Entamoeba invadens IP1]ELP93664.1 hypothetical protein EIN_005650 [Entamoeba invadens IP1]|eukprot:XP_004260435.1 hypothetical protein EIN_005650 [Entamoeba invadens IP1]